MEKVSQNVGCAKVLWESVRLLGEVFFTRMYFMKPESPPSTTHDLLVAKFAALLAECDLIATNEQTLDTIRYVSILIFYRNSERNSVSGLSLASMTSRRSHVGWVFSMWAKSGVWLHRRWTRLCSCAASGTKPLRSAKEITRREC